MSRDIWMRCGGRSSCRTIEATPWRVVESQQRISTRQLVDSVAEHELLEQLIEDSKPALPPAREFEGLDFLLFTPFRYPPLLHGSRFGSTLERGIWYGSERLETALAELAYYRLLLFEGTAAELTPNRVAKSVFQAAVRSTSAVDLTRAPFDAHREAISAPDDYGVSQRLGSAMREEGVELCRSWSARDPAGGVNVAVFSPRAFALKRPLAPPQTWYCTVTPARDVSWVREDFSELKLVEFARGDFLVGGKFPEPGV
jgi:hypothetical protein